MEPRFAIVDDAANRSRHHLLDQGRHDAPRPLLIATGDGHELEALADVLNEHPDSYDRALAALDHGEPF